MGYYNVVVEETIIYEVEVEAENQQQAEMQAVGVVQNGDAEPTGGNFTILSLHEIEEDA